MNITVEGKTNLIGSVIGGGNTTLRTGELEYSELKNGEKKEFILFQNETHGNWSDLVESAYDKFGIKGRRKIYSNAAKEVGETIYLNRDRIDDFTMFSQGNIQWRAGLEYIEEKYGEGVLKEITTKIKYRTWQLPLIGVDKILRLFNPKEYFDKEKYNPTINKGVDENDKK